MILIPANMYDPEAAYCLAMLGADTIIYMSRDYHIRPTLRNKGEFWEVHLTTAMPFPSVKTGRPPVILRRLGHPGTMLVEPLSEEERGRVIVDLLPAGITDFRFYGDKD